MLSFSDWLKMTDLHQSRTIKILLFIIIHLFTACSAFQNVSDQRDLCQNYLKAVKDAEVAEPNEISRNLTAIVPTNMDLLWQGEPGNMRVLVVTWTSWKVYNDKEGQPVVIPKNIWVTTVPELKKFCKSKKLAQKEINLRIEQLLGLPPDSGKTIFVEFWVNPDDLFRPSPDPEITDCEAELDFPGSDRFVKVSGDHVKWFNDLKDKSYGENGYPWTRLGYTYDWGNPDGEVGLSEFVIRAGASVEIHSVTETQDYCNPN